LRQHSSRSLRIFTTRKSPRRKAIETRGRVRRGSLFRHDSKESAPKGN